MVFHTSIEPSVNDKSVSSIVPQIEQAKEDMMYHIIRCCLTPFRDLRRWREGDKVMFLSQL